MRSLLGFVAVVLFVGQAAASDVEIKGPHICCKQCVKVVGGILAKVDGVSDAKCDIQAKTISFTAKDEKPPKQASRPSSMRVSSAPPP